MISHMVLCYYPKTNFHLVKQHQRHPKQNEDFTHHNHQIQDCQHIFGHNFTHYEPDAKNTLVVGIHRLVT